MAEKKSKKKKSEGLNNISVNRKAKFDYEFVERIEAGLVLEGWEVKSLRAGHGQLRDSYVTLKKGEAFLLGAHIPPLLSASTHIDPDPMRMRKILLNRKELNQLTVAVERKGFTVVPLRFYWKARHIKCELALARGKKLYDKRETEKNRDWQRTQARTLKHS